MLFSSNPHITSNVATDQVGGSDLMDISDISFDMNDLDVSSLSTQMIGPESFINHVLTPVNQAENKVFASAAVALDNPLDSKSSVALQMSVVEYSKNLTIASKCAKLASDFVKETTHVQ